MGREAVLIVVLIVVASTAAVVGIHKAAEVVIEAGGIQPMIETVWCGKPGCMSGSKN